MDTSKKNWGGQWTEEKLDAFEKYVKAYLTIMNNYRDTYGWEILYFDGFAGSGSRSPEEIEQEYLSASNLFGENISKDEMNIYQGAAERVVSLESKGIRSFDKYCFVEKNVESRKSLEEKLSRYHVSGKMYYSQTDANEAIGKFVSYLQKDKRRKALVFLDPFGMQVSWKTLKELASCKIDLWILVPTGVIINRLLERDVDLNKGLIHAKKLSTYFGIPEDEIFSTFYKVETEPSLFEESTTKVSKVEGAIGKIADLYVNRLNTIFEYVTDSPFILYNNNNVPIFHLVFASHNRTAKKIAQDIIDFKQ